MKDFTYINIKTASAIPRAAAMIETFRAIGYTLETAVADIVDNSISASAKNVWINRIWKGGDSVITIRDDGHGMSGDEIIQAMRPGAQNPLEERSATDLGRFGLGLKTASFSQCRTLTVMSKIQGQAPEFWTWSLDHVARCDRWELVHWLPKGFEHELDNLASGTIIIWTDPDRIIPAATKAENENAKRKFSEAFDRVKKHLSMTFHRFLEAKSVAIHWCGHEIDPWNPFCPKESKVQIMPSEQIGEYVTVKGFILPHKNNFSSEVAYKQAEGIFGFSTHQGFYVYRGDRLLLAGNWLGLFRREEAYKLVRIQINLPNCVDSDWQIDIRKAKAFPPVGCRQQLESYARQACNKGAEVYRHRGRILRQRAGLEFQSIWLEKKKDNKWSFVVNREHALVRNIRELARENPDKAIDMLLRFVEESIPAKTIYVREANDDDSQKQPYSDMDPGLLHTMVRRIYEGQLAQGLTPEQSRLALKQMEPFNEYENLIEELQ